MADYQLFKNLKSYYIIFQKRNIIYIMLNRIIIDAINILVRLNVVISSPDRYTIQNIFPFYLLTAYAFPVLQFYHLL